MASRLLLSPSWLLRRQPRMAAAAAARASGVASAASRGPAAASSARPFSTSGAGSASGSGGSGGASPTAGLAGPKRGGTGGIASIFDRSLKQHYHSNKPALDRIALSFLFFYCTGHMFLQKQRCNELEEELALLRREKKGLEASLRDEGWAKGVAKQLGVRDPSKLLAALAARVKENAGDLSREDMARPTISIPGLSVSGGPDAAAAATGASSGKPGNAMF